MQGQLFASHPTPIDPGRLRGWLLLEQAPGLSAAQRRQWLDEFGDIPTILEAIASGEIDLPTRARDWFDDAVPVHLDSSLAWLENSPRHHLVDWANPDYPPLLREIPDPPLLLYVDGDSDVLQRPQLAIVGSRKPSGGGQDNARQFARALAETGLVVTSGLALGIDAAAHAGALDGSGGKTIAVLGNGLDRIYPASNAKLAAAIRERGAIISEFPPGTAPLPGHFPRRNRIISGMSLGVLVVEAAVRSGSLITARLAAEQGREVFAIPGSIHNPLARGCHRLLRDGARLVECLEDIGSELGALASLYRDETPQSATHNPENPEHADLLEHIGFDPVNIDTLVERSGLTAERVSSILLLLELQGKLAALEGGTFQRRHDTIPT